MTVIRADRQLFQIIQRLNYGNDSRNGNITYINKYIIKIIHKRNKERLVTFGFGMISDSLECVPKVLFPSLTKMSVVLLAKS